MNDNNVQVLNQYLTFTLNNEKYGIDIVNTREVLETTELTKVPRMPDFMCGVINLRGSVVPVIDLKLKFNMGSLTDNERNNVIVTEINDLDSGDEKLTIGIFCDSVQKVLTIEPENIESAPKIGIPINTEFIHGMGKVKDEFIILLNINKILTSKDLNQIVSDGDESNEESDGN
ncbi:MAG: chemotaxis protein CheW [Spirochaetaceae bacterium]